MVTMSASDDSRKSGKTPFLANARKPLTFQLTMRMWIAYCWLVVDLNDVLQRLVE